MNGPIPIAWNTCKNRPKLGQLSGLFSVVPFPDPVRRLSVLRFAGFQLCRFRCRSVTEQPAPLRFALDFIRSNDDVPEALLKFHAGRHKVGRSCLLDTKGPAISRQTSHTTEALRNRLRLSMSAGKRSEEPVPNPVSTAAADTPL